METITLTYRVASEKNIFSVSCLDIEHSYTITSLT